MLQPAETVHPNAQLVGICGKIETQTSLGKCTLIEPSGERYCRSDYLITLTLKSLIDKISNNSDYQQKTSSYPEKWRVKRTIST